MKNIRFNQRLMASIHRLSLDDYADSLGHSLDLAFLPGWYGSAIRRSGAIVYPKCLTRSGSNQT